MGELRVSGRQPLRLSGVIACALVRLARLVPHRQERRLLTRLQALQCLWAVSTCLWLVVTPPSVPLHGCGPFVLVGFVSCPWSSSPPDGEPRCPVAHVDSAPEQPCVCAWVHGRFFFFAFFPYSPFLRTAGPARWIFSSFLAVVVSCCCRCCRFCPDPSPPPLPRLASI